MNDKTQLLAISILNSARLVGGSTKVGMNLPLPVLEALRQAADDLGVPLSTAAARLFVTALMQHMKDRNSASGRAQRKAMRAAQEEALRRHSSMERDRSRRAREAARVLSAMASAREGLDQ